MRRNEIAFVVFDNEDGTVGMKIKKQYPLAADKREATAAEMAAAEIMALLVTVGTLTASED